MDPSTEVSTRVVAGRYRIRREVGRGGMATVYQALDEKHGREVALKVLRPDLAERVGPERFLREIEITASLNHPHVLPLLDSGADDDRLFYVTPFVEGGSLRLRMGADPLPLEAVVRVARQVAAALDHAHARGIVHRDVKPENILFNEGLAVVSDFGIARAVEGGEAARMTGTGQSIGTLGYMSPEQALGRDELGPATDVYSLASVVYEMLMGETPASWPGPEDVRLGRLGDLPALHRSRLERYPGRVEQVLTRALALRAEDRFPTAGAFARALAEAGAGTRPVGDGEVRRLLDRAAELQAREPEAGSLTLGGVERIAAEVGIPPEHVREAVREGGRSLAPARPVEVVRRGAMRDGSPWNRVTVETTVGGTVSPERYPAIVSEIERRLDLVGHASIIDRALTWSPAAPTTDTRRVVLRVWPADGETRIRIDESIELGGAAKVIPPVGGLFGVLTGGGFASSLGLGAPAGPLLVIVFGVIGVALAVYMAVRLHRDDREPQLAALAESLARLAGGSEGAGAGSA